METTKIIKPLIRRPNAEVDFGKIPPQSIPMEEAVLSACLIEDCISEVASILKPEHFYKSEHELIFSAMVRLFSRSCPIDLLTVTEDLREHGSLDSVGGPFAIAQLSNKVGSAANVEFHALVVKERWVSRAIISRSADTLRDAYDETTDPFDLLEKAGKSLDEISKEVQSSEQKDFYSVLVNQIEGIKVAASKKDDEKYVLGLPTGLYTLDRKVLGWTEPDLIILAGRPGEGKTSFAIQSADTILSRGEPVGFVSAEMKMEQLNLKLLSLNTDIDVSRLRTGALKSDEWDKVMEAKKRMAHYNLQVFDKPCTPDAAKSIAKAWKKKFGIKAFFFDYIQRASIPKYLLGASRNDQITVITNTLKDIALGLEMPVIALSQMSRDIEKRSGENKRPQISDLRDGGSIEQDADIIIFVYRPEIHGIKSFSDGTSTKNCTEFIIEKHRLGTHGAVVAKFIGSGNRFDDSDFSKFNQQYKSEAVVATGRLPYADDTDNTPF